jgi:glycerate dehydrogenase
MNIVFLETSTLGADIDLTGFSALGRVTTYPASDPEQNKARIMDADVVVLNKIPVDGSLLDGVDRVKLVCLTATGTNNVDFEYCEKRGIAVRNVKGYSTWSVAQHTFALLFYVYEKLSYYDDFVKSGRYCENPLFSHFEEPFHELLGKTWGIIGLGEIGRKVADIAKTFGCNVQYYSTSGRNDQPDYRRVTLRELLETSDIISIHAPLNSDTENLIDERAFALMKREAVLLNLGRGPIVNEQALADALNHNRIAGAGLDVLSVEPMRRDNPLFPIKDSTKLIITPHIGWGTREARQRCVDAVLENIRAFFAD